MKFSAQTAEQAIEKGLQELGKTREEVEIVIVSEGKKGFLGIFGGKPAISPLIKGQKFNLRFTPLL